MEFKGLRETRGSGSFSSRTKTVLSNEYGKILPESQQLNVWGGGSRETGQWGRFMRKEGSPNKIQPQALP